MLNVYIQYDDTNYLLQIEEGLGRTSIFCGCVLITILFANSFNFCSSTQTQEKTYKNCKYILWIEFGNYYYHANQAQTYSRAMARGHKGTPGVEKRMRPSTTLVPILFELSFSSRCKSWFHAQTKYSSTFKRLSIETTNGYIYLLWLHFLSGPTSLMLFVITIIALVWANVELFWGVAFLEKYPPLSF